MASSSSSGIEVQHTEDILAGLTLNPNMQQPFIAARNEIRASPSSGSAVRILRSNRPPLARSDSWDIEVEHIEDIAAGQPVAQAPTSTPHNSCPLPASGSTILVRSNRPALARSTSWDVEIEHVEDVMVESAISPVQQSPIPATHENRPSANRSTTGSGLSNTSSTEENRNEMTGSMFNFRGSGDINTTPRLVSQRRTASRLPKSTRITRAAASSNEATSSNPNTSTSTFTPPTVLPSEVSSSKNALPPSKQYRDPIARRVQKLTNQPSPEMDTIHSPQQVLPQQRPPPPFGIIGQPRTVSTHPLQDYMTQLVLLEIMTKKRLILAFEEREDLRAMMHPYGPPPPESSNSPPVSTSQTTASLSESADEIPKSPSTATSAVPCPADDPDDIYGVSDDEVERQKVRRRRQQELVNSLQRGPFILADPPSSRRRNHLSTRQSELHVQIHPALDAASASASQSHPSKNVSLKLPGSKDMPAASLRGTEQRPAMISQGAQIDDYLFQTSSHRPSTAPVAQKPHSCPSPHLPVEESQNPQDCHEQFSSGEIQSIETVAEILFDLWQHNQESYVQPFSVRAPSPGWSTDAMSLLSPGPSSRENDSEDEGDNEDDEETEAEADSEATSDSQEENEDGINRVSPRAVPLRPWNGRQRRGSMAPPCSCQAFAMHERRNQRHADEGKTSEVSKGEQKETEEATSADGNPEETASVPQSVRVAEQDYFSTPIHPDVALFYLLNTDLADYNVERPWVSLEEFHGALETAGVTVEGFCRTHDLTIEEMHRIFGFTAAELLAWEHACGKQPEIKNGKQKATDQDGNAKEEGTTSYFSQFGDDDDFFMALPSRMAATFHEFWYSDRNRASDETWGSTNEEFRSNSELFGLKADTFCEDMRISVEELCKIWRRTEDKMLDDARTPRSADNGVGSRPYNTVEDFHSELELFGLTVEEICKRMGLTVEELYSTYGFTNDDFKGTTKTPNNVEEGNDEGNSGHFAPSIVSPRLENSDCERDIVLGDQAEEQGDEGEEEGGQSGDEDWVCTAGIEVGESEDEDEDWIKVDR